MRTHNNGSIEVPNRNSRTCLIARRPRNLRSYEIADEIEEGAPRHPHVGSGLALHLRSQGFEVFFGGPVGNRRVRSLFRRRRGWISPTSPTTHRNFDAVICDSAREAIRVRLSSRLTGHRPATILIVLSHSNPAGPRWKVVMRRMTSELAVRRADAVVYALEELGDKFMRQRACDPERLFYAPTCVDTEFFDPARTQPSHRPAELNARRFLLAAGDSSRDDELLYHALAPAQLPIIRVTRDPAVVKRVNSLFRRDRGDLVLSRIGFEQLRWLYSNCTACIFTSRLDQWQAAGSTALTEAMACNALCVVNGGGCIEREWRHLARRADVDCPIIFYKPSEPDELRGAIAAATVSLPRFTDHRNRSRTMALRAFPIERAYQSIGAAVQRVFERGASGAPAASAEELIAR